MYAREEGLVAVHINGDKDLTDIIDKIRKKEREWLNERGGKSLLWKLSNQVQIFSDILEKKADWKERRNNGSKTK